MLRQQTLALASKVSQRAATLRLMLSTNAVPDSSFRLDTPAPLKVMPSGSRPGSHRTWNACHGITFASSHGDTPSQTLSRPIDGRPSAGASSQDNAGFCSEPQTQHVRLRDENHEGFGDSVSTERSMQPQCGRTTTDSSRGDGSHSSNAGQIEDCLASDIKTFRSPLGFHIPEPKLRDAMLAGPTSTASYWHFTLYQGPGGESDKVKVHYCKSKETTEKIAQLFLDKEVIGFDIEWSPNSSADGGITKNVSLIQIASEERVLLAHIARYPNATISEKEQRVEDFVAPSLKRIMESPSVSKVGVSVKADCTRLRKFLGIDSHGLFELSHLYKLVKYSSGDVTKINKALVSLAQQVSEHLYLPLAKGDVRMSDWSKSLDLTYEQTRYAASDTYAALQLYYILEAKRSALEPIPPRPAHAELNLEIRLADGRRVDISDEALEPIEEAIIGAPSTTGISLDEDFQMMAIKDPASLYPELPASPAPSSSSSSSLSSPSPTSPPPLSPKPLSTAPPSNKAIAPEIIEANASVTRYIEQTRPATIKIKPNKAHLRAHHLWQHLSMDPPAIAALLRVDGSTVAVYILQAIKIEHFHFDEERTRDLVPLAPRVLREHFESMIANRVRRRHEGGRE